MVLSLGICWWSQKSSSHWYVMLSPTVMFTSVTTLRWVLAGASGYDSTLQWVQRQMLG